LVQTPRLPAEIAGRYVSTGTEIRVLTPTAIAFGCAGWFIALVGDRKAIAAGQVAGSSLHDKVCP